MRHDLRLLAVVTIALLLPACRPSGMCESAAIRIRNAREAVLLYQFEFGKLPSESEGLEVLVHPLRGSAFLSSVPADPWERPLRYRTGSELEGGFEIRSAGPDGVPGTEDDVVATCPKRWPGFRHLFEIE
jgi:hypothetical protein